MKQKNLEALFHETLKDIYYAERRILRALPKMAKGAQSAELKAGFEKHAQETQGHIERLQQVFEMMEKPARGKTCPAIDGILEEGEEILDTFKGTGVIDAGLIASAQAVEHYEMARYATLHGWANALGMTDAAALLGETLAEEQATDTALSELATASVTAEALEAA